MFVRVFLYPRFLGQFGSGETCPFGRTFGTHIVITLTPSLSLKLPFVASHSPPTLTVQSPSSRMSQIRQGDKKAADWVRGNFLARNCWRVLRLRIVRIFAEVGFWVFKGLKVRIKSTCVWIRYVSTITHSPQRILTDDDTKLTSQKRIHIFQTNSQDRLFQYVAKCCGLGNTSYKYLYQRFALFPCPS